MFESLKRLFSPSSAPSAEPASAAEDKIPVAACALLLEMAGADGEMSALEEKRILELIKAQFSLSEDGARQLIEVTREYRENQVDLFRFTNLINRHFSIAEKEAVMEAVWRVIYADGRIDDYEDYLVRRLTKLLRLTHRQMIDAKIKIKDQRESNPEG